MVKKDKMVKKHVKEKPYRKETFFFSTRDLSVIAFVVLFSRKTIYCFISGRA